MTAFPVSHDKPVPPCSRGGKTRAVYPWDQLDVGGSFFVPGKTAQQFGGATAVATRRGWKVTLRARVEQGCRGVRVWRIA